LDKHTGGERLEHMPGSTACCSKQQTNGSGVIAKICFNPVFFDPVHAPNVTDILTDIKASLFF